MFFFFGGKMSNLMGDQATQHMMKQNIMKEEFYNYIQNLHGGNAIDARLIKC